MPRRKKTTQVSRPEEIVLRRFSKDELLEQRRRERLMWGAVSFIGLAMFVVWTVNLRSSVKASTANESVDALAELKESLVDDWQNASTSVGSMVGQAQASSSQNLSQVDEKYNTNLVEVNQKLKELIDKNASSSLNNR